MSRRSFRSQHILYSSLFSNFLLIYINCAMGLHCDVCTCLHVMHFAVFTHWFYCDVCTRPCDALRLYSHTDSTVMSSHVCVMYFARIHIHFHSLIKSPISPSLPCTYLSLFNFTFFSPMTFTDKGKYRIVEQHNLINSCSHHILQEMT